MAKSKLNSSETLASQALISMEISREEFITILKEKDKYEKMKENMRNVSEKQENMRLNSVNLKTKLCQKQPKLWNIFSIKKILFFLSMHKMYTYSIKTWKKNGVEEINYDGKKWINQTQLGNTLGHSNIPPRTEYYSSKF